MALARPRRSLRRKHEADQLVSLRQHFRLPALVDLDKGDAFDRRGAFRTNVLTNGRERLLLALELAERVAGLQVPNLECRHDVTLVDPSHTLDTFAQRLGISPDRKMTGRSALRTADFYVRGQCDLGDEGAEGVPTRMTTGLLELRKYRYAQQQFALAGCPEAGAERGRRHEVALLGRIRPDNAVSKPWFHIGHSAKRTAPT